ncbi:hypothetical protein JG687_00016794, partial [Phytophthora cactorum]
NIGSGKGKTSGHGHLGQGALSGGRSDRGPCFGGGQTSLYQRVPKRSFNSRFATPMENVNLDKLQFFVDMDRLNTSNKIAIRSSWTPDSRPVHASSTASNCSATTASTSRPSWTLKSRRSLSLARCCRSRRVRIPRSSRTTCRRNSGQEGARQR